mgnify:FL=1
MFVCSNRKIAYAFYQIIVGMRPEWAEKKVCPDGVELTEKEKKELKPIEKIKLIMTRNKDDEPELYEMLGTKDDRKEFDRQFKNVKSNFKIAIVVDMWLTGFDVPALDTIYIDKPIQQHSLIQTISRVNRVYTGKDKGLIVDYIGIKKNMNLALKKYTNFESDELKASSSLSRLLKTSSMSWLRCSTTSIARITSTAHRKSSLLASIGLLSMYSSRKIWKLALWRQSNA